MKYYCFPNTKPVKAGFMLFLLAVQMLSRSSMVTSTFLEFMPSQFIMIGLVLAAGLVFLIYNHKNLREILTDRRMAAVVLVTVLMVMNMVIKQDFQMLYFSILLYIYFAIFLNYFLPLEVAARYYVLLMFGLSAYALLGQFVLKPMVHWGIIPGFPFDSPGGWHMFNFGLAYTVDKNTEMMDALRLFGIFREPGLYQVFLFIAILLNNEILIWKNQWKMWAINIVLFAALVVTFATGGVLALGLYIVFLFFEKGLYRNKKICIAAAVAIAAGVVLVMVAVANGGAWALELVWMVLKVTQKSVSYVDRVDSIMMNVRIFLEHPLVGDRISDVLHAVLNNTATSPILFASFGIVGGSLHVASWVALLWKKERKLLGNLVILVIAFVPFNTQNVIHDMFFWLFPVMALTEKGLPLLEQRLLNRRNR